MAGIFSFVTGLLALGGSAGITLYEDEKQWQTDEQRRQAGYNTAVQKHYEYRPNYLLSKYDYSKVGEAIKRDYPSMTVHNLHKITMAAITKRVMEEETPYKFEPGAWDGSMYFDDLDKYTPDEFRVKPSE